MLLLLDNLRVHNSTLVKACVAYRMGHACAFLPTQLEPESRPRRAVQLGFWVSDG